MPKIAKKDFELIRNGLQKYLPIIEDAEKRDINKLDTIVLVNDVLEGIFRFDKYNDVTNDFFITTTFCDLALYIDKKISILMNVKPIGIPLSYDEIKKARNYAITKGIEYVVLTNCAHWQIYDCHPDKSLNKDLLLEFDLLQIDPDEKADVKKVFALSRQGIKRSIARKYKEREEVMNIDTIGALMLSDKFVNTLKRELQHLDSHHHYDKEEIKYFLQREILKRSIVEDKKMAKSLKKIRDLSYSVDKKAKSTRPIISPSKILSEGMNQHQYKE